MDADSPHDGLKIPRRITVMAVEAQWLREIGFVLCDLEDEGLIEWKERAWALTEAGRFAIERNTDPRSGGVLRA